MLFRSSSPARIGTRSRAFYHTAGGWGILFVMSDKKSIWQCRWCRKSWHEAFGEEEFESRRRYCSRKCCKQSDYARNGESIRGAARAYYQANRHKSNLRRKEHYEANRRKELIARKINWRENREKYVLRKKDLFAKKYYTLKFSVYKKYGNKCAVCGESRQPCLSIDHINGDGKEHRKHKSSLRILQDVLGDESGRFQILCMNCQWIKRSENKEWKSRVFYLPEKIPAPISQSGE